MEVDDRLSKPVGGLSALLDHFGDMVGVFSFFLYLCIVVEMAPKLAFSHFGSS